MPKKTMLVAGASGLVGFAALKHFAQREDWDVIGVSRRIPSGLMVAAGGLTQHERTVNTEHRHANTSH